MTTEEKVLKIVKKSNGKSHSLQIAKELEISSGYVDFILKTLQRKGKVKLSGRLVFLKEAPSITPVSVSSFAKAPRGKKIMSKAPRDRNKPRTKGKSKKRTKKKAKKTTTRSPRPSSPRFTRARPLAEKPKVRKKKRNKLWPKKALQQFFGWLRQNRKM